MLRFLFTGFLLIASLATLNCQSYTTGLQQGAGRADEGAVLAQLRAIARAQTAYSISNASVRKNNSFITVNHCFAFGM